MRARVVRSDPLHEREARADAGRRGARLALLLVQLHCHERDVKFSQGTIAKLEKDTTRADHLTVNEALAISFALSVSPLCMLVPLDELEPRLYISRAVQPPTPSEARAWLRGEKELIGQNPRTFAVQRPDDEQAEALANLPPGYVVEITSAWRPPKEER
jgi:hypothetical protein